MSLVCLTRVSDVLNRMNGRVEGGGIKMTAHVRRLYPLSVAVVSTLRATV